MKERRQLHQFFIVCKLEPHLHALAAVIVGVEGGIGQVCLEAFVVAGVRPPAIQQQGSKTLRDMGLGMVDEARCGTRDTRSTCWYQLRPRNERWALEFDGPTHFVTGSEAPMGATLI